MPGLAEQLRNEGRLEGYEKGFLEGYEKGFLEGFQKGQLEGLQKGEKKKAKEVAWNMLNENYPLSAIMKHSGLTEQEIYALKSEYIPRG